MSFCKQLSRLSRLGLSFPVYPPKAVTFYDEKVIYIMLTQIMRPAFAPQKISVAPSSDFPVSVSYTRFSQRSAISDQKIIRIHATGNVYSASLLHPWSARIFSSHTISHEETVSKWKKACPFGSTLLIQWTAIFPSSISKGNTSEVVSRMMIPVSKEYKKIIMVKMGFEGYELQPMFYSFHTPKQHNIRRSLIRYYFSVLRIALTFAAAVSVLPAHPQCVNPIILRVRRGNALPKLFLSFRTRQIELLYIF